MARRRWKKEIKYYDYECTLTGEKFRMLKEAPNPGELISVKGYYELNPEKDDRPEVVKKQVGAEEVTRASYEEPEEEEAPAETAEEEAVVEEGTVVEQETAQEGVE